MGKRQRRSLNNFHATAFLFLTPNESEVVKMVVIIIIKTVGLAIFLKINYD